ncbi:MAG: hypothetical protein ACRCSR_07580 [Bacteroidales bacterium]
MKYNLKPAVLLSKTDKKPVEEVLNVKNYVSYQIQKSLGESTYIGCISSADRNITDFNTFIDSIECDVLVKQKYGQMIKSFVSLQIISIGTNLDVLGLKVQNITQKIKELELLKEKITKDISGNIPNADTPEKSTQDILGNVKDELFLNAESIAKMIVNKQSANEINAQILNIIRPVFINSFQEEAEQYASALNTVIDGISKDTLNNLEITGNFIDSIVDSMREDIVGVIRMAGEALTRLGNPIVKILGYFVILLGDAIPSFIKWIFGKSNSQLIEEVSCKLKEKTINELCEKLRPEIFTKVVAQQKIIRENIELNISNSIKNLTESLNLSLVEQDKADLNSKIDEMKTCINKLYGLTEEM